jgi:hypothetical protein
MGYIHLTSLEYPRLHPYQEHCQIAHQCIEEPVDHPLWGPVPWNILQTPDLHDLSVPSLNKMTAHALASLERELGHSSLQSRLCVLSAYVV